MIALVYDPALVSDPEALAADLGVGCLIAGAPPRYALTLPEAGYAVVRETWAGIDVLPGPVTPEQLATLPDPGPDPTLVEVERREAVRAAMREEVTIDPDLIRQAIGRLDDIIATGSLPALPDSPTTAEVVAQVRRLTTAVNREADAIRDLARVLRAALRLLA